VTHTLDTSDLLADIRDHICQTMLIGLSDQTIEPDESLLERGVIDSTGVLELVEFLEDRFGIDVDDTEITTDNLDSLNAITTYVRRKLAREAAGEELPDGDDAPAHVK
jgi:acyl carrier protein